MYQIRDASPADLSLIHKMQNLPVREKIMNRPLPPLEDFVTNTAQKMRDGCEKYYLLEQHGEAEGFIWISLAAETCEIWGKQLHSLFYACARIAFENLSLNRLVWSVRQNNRRMLKICERFGIRSIGSDQICVIENKFEFIAIGKIHYFEFKAEEYPERISVMRKFSVQQGEFFQTV